MEYALYCTGLQTTHRARGSRDRGPHPRRDLGAIIDERSTERATLADIEDDLTAMNRLVGEMLPGQQSSHEDVVRAAWRVSRSRTHLTFRGHRWFVSEAGQRMQIPNDSLVVTEGGGGRTFEFTCPTCGLSRRFSEGDLMELIDVLKAQGKTSMNLAP